MQSEILIEKVNEEVNEEVEEYDDAYENWFDLELEFLDYINYNGATLEDCDLLEMAELLKDMADERGLYISKMDALEHLISKLQLRCILAYEQIENLEAKHED